MVVDDGVRRDRTRSRSVAGPGLSIWLASGFWTLTVDDARAIEQAEFLRFRNEKWDSLVRPALNAVQPEGADLSVPANRAAFGRTKVERELEKARAEKARRELEGKKRE